MVYTWFIPSFVPSVIPTFIPTFIPTQRYYLFRHKQKEDKSFDLSSVVDYTGKISNLLEDIEKLDRFAESVEDELLNLMIEKAES